MISRQSAFHSRFHLSVVAFCCCLVFGIAEELADEFYSEWTMAQVCLQSFDAVVWVAARASGL